MNLKQYKFLRYLLIVLLMVMPMRGALAMQESHCDMDEMMMSSHHEGMMQTHDMSAMTMPDSTQQSNNQCCCCDGADCTGNCSMGISVPLLLQASLFVPHFNNVSESEPITENILVRALTPPSRPPAKLHN